MRLVNADDLDFFFCDTVEECSFALGNAPTVDAVPVVHGQWVDCENHNDIEQCSVCGMIYRYPSFYKYNYCPNCGAKMDGGDGNGI